jgi:two-component system, chemotaxis family, CheB/CheR fusion protein
MAKKRPMAKSKGTDKERPRPKVAGAKPSARDGRGKKKPVSKQPPESDPRSPALAPAGGDGEAAAPEAPPVAFNVRDEPEDCAQPEGPSFTVVGVGASAGGLEAFRELLRSLPPDSDLAVVYIQHLAPHYESTLAALLAETTTMPVAQVIDKTPLKPGHVYVIPPNKFLSISRGNLRLTPRPDGRAQHAPVDYFFRSLAEYAQQRAVGVVLSGTDSDGAAGLREIKAVGGLTFAQDPATAKFDGMPRAAISTGAIDTVLPPDAIARELARIANHLLFRHVKARTRETELAVSDDHWRKIFALLRGSSGVDFTHYKQPTLRRRLQRRMVLHKISAVDQYLRFLHQNPQEVNALYQDILIHVTRFFREPDSYQFLADNVFPRVVRDRRTGDQPLRLWVPGCSTGEEAYSVAICLLEFLGDDATASPVQVFATDVSESAVEQARAGVYPESIAADVSPERLSRFFNKIDGSYRISQHVRDAVIFARQDLTRDPPFSKIDLIVCRNVLIYLGPLLQKKLMNVFHYALKPTGFLMLGASETIGPHSDLFTLADKRHKVYTKKITGVRMNMDFPAQQRTYDRADSVRKQPPDNRTEPGIVNEANRVILTRYSPPGVIVDEDLHIIQFRGQTGPYLEPAPGEASLNLLKMAREGLLYDLRAALAEARKTGGPARRENLRVKFNGHIIDLNIEAVPLVIGHDHRHFLILFQDVTPEPSAPAASAPGKKSPAPSGRRKAVSGRPGTKSESDKSVVRLHQELAATREYLQSIIQDLEATNEELQSANEEILSSNEELQSTNEELDTAKEELQSTNEELNTLNEELQGRNEELSRANSDLLNLLSSVQLAVVIVSGDLRIRRFTPMAEKVLNLIPTDVGRPIGNIKPNIDLPDLETLITEAVDTVSPIEREAKDRNGTPYLLRIRPYKNLENRIDGAVVTLFDLTMGRRHDRPAAHAQALLDGIFSVTDEPLMVLDNRNRLIAANPAFSRTFKIDADGHLNRSVYELSLGQWDLPPLRELLERILPRDGAVNDWTLEQTFNETGKMTLHINARRVDRKGEPGLTVLSIKSLCNPKADG